jgi:hypothetical protein
MELVSIPVTLTNDCAKDLFHCNEALVLSHTHSIMVTYMLANHSAEYVSMLYCKFYVDKLEIIQKHCVRFQVLTAKNVNVAVCWDIVPCSLVEIDRCVRGASAGIWCHVVW